MFISNARAEEAPAQVTASTATPSMPTGEQGGEPSILVSMAPMLLIFVVFYFLLIRPQQRKIREHDTMVKALRRGDKVVTGGGIVGIISKVEADGMLLVEIAPEVKVRVLTETVSQVVTKTVANDNAAGDAKKTEEKRK